MSDNSQSGVVEPPLITTSKDTKSLAVNSSNKRALKIFFYK